MIWKCPKITVSNLCLDMQNQAHILIAGSTGSGKSVLVNSFIYSMLYKSPEKLELILIDPKRVELVKYRKLPQCRKYATENRDIIAALSHAIDTMEKRYKQMQRHGTVKYDGSEIWIIIDELADLMTTCKKQVTPLLCRLTQLGRAANIHVLAATQRPTREIITGQIKVNLDCRIALRCPARQDSVNIIGRGGAELLPRYGNGYYMVPAGITLEEIPYTEPETINNTIEHWTKQKPLLWF